MRESHKNAFAQPLRFSGVGILNTLAGLVVIYLAKWWFGLNDIAANATGYAVGLMVSFALNGRWTFRFKGRLGRRLPRFVLVIVAAYLANLITVSAAIFGIGINGYVAQAVGVAPYALISYLGMKYFVFADHPLNDDEG